MDRLLLLYLLEPNSLFLHIPPQWYIKTSSIQLHLLLYKEIGTWALLETVRKPKLTVYDFSGSIRIVNKSRTKFLDQLAINLLFFASNGKVEGERCFLCLVAKVLKWRYKSSHLIANRYIAL